MHDNEISYQKAARAGLIPFIRNEDDGTLSYLMMVSSDPRYGGPRPMISKGKIEPDETKMGAAIREAEEELGLKQRNFRGEPMLIADERVTLYSGAYDLTVYGVEIADRYDFDKWCDETAYTCWCTLEKFKKIGRRDHIKYVELLEQLVRK